MRRKVKKSFSFTSPSPMVDTPSIIAFLKSQYVFKNQQKRLHAVVWNGYCDGQDEDDVPTRDEIHKLLTGEIPYTVGDDRSVNFDVDRWEGYTDDFVDRKTVLAA